MAFSRASSGFDYSLSAYPDLVAGDTVEVWLVVANSSQAAITVAGFQLTIPQAGTHADELTADVGAIQPNGPDGWSTSPGPAFRFLPPGGSHVVLPDDSLTFRLTNVAVNATPGPVSFSISDGVNPPTSITLTKLPPGFRLSALNAVPTVATGYPGSTSLSWTGPPLDSPYAPGYSLSWVADEGDGDETKTVNGLAAASAHYAVTGLTHESTTITLTVSYTNNGQPATVIRQVTVSVPVPAPKASLTITPIWYGLDDLISLAWNVEHASVVSIDPGLGTVDDTGTHPIGTARTAPIYTLSADVLPGYAGGRAVVAARPTPYTLTTLNDGSIRPNGLAVSPDGTTMYVSNDYGSMSAEWMTLDAHTLASTGAASSSSFGRPGNLLVSPDGKWLYNLVNSGNALARNTLPGFGSNSEYIYLEGQDATMAMAPDGTWLAIAAGNALQRIDLAGWTATATATFGTSEFRVQCIAISPDSQTAYAIGPTDYGGQNFNVIRYSGAALGGGAITPLPVHGSSYNGICSAVAVAPDGASIVAVVDTTVFRLDATTMTISAQVPLPALLQFGPITPTGVMRWAGRWLLIGTDQGLLVVDGTTLALVTSAFLTDGLSRSVTQVAVSADGRSVWWNGYQADDDDESAPGTISALTGLPR